VPTGTGLVGAISNDGTAPKLTAEVHHNTMADTVLFRSVLGS
jgi:hypothetical protein